MSTITFPEVDLCSPDSVESFANEIQRVRAGLLFDSNTSGLSPFAEQHLILAIECLQSCSSHLKLVALFQAQALAVMHR